MKIVVFGLSISSSWGNGHATLWRGLVRALARRGVRVVFFERDVPYYAENRDLHEIDGGRLVLYRDWAEVAGQAAAELRDADVAIVTSFAVDALPAAELIARKSRAMRVFYDLDTPVTLARLQAGEHVAYIGSNGLSGYDLVLSYTGGGALEALRARLGARRVAPLYGHVDPETHRPAEPIPRFSADLSYLGTWGQDRAAALERTFVAAAARAPELRFLIAGAQYPADFPWQPNIYFVRHLPPAEHPAFFSSSRATLNLTRPAMAAMGWCPSGRLFEAAACGAPVISDSWDGLADFYEPGREILIAEDASDVLQLLRMDDGRLAAIGRAARKRTLAEHTSAARADELLRIVECARAEPA